MDLRETARREKEGDEKGISLIRKNKFFCKDMIWFGWCVLF